MSDRSRSTAMPSHEDATPAATDALVRLCSFEVGDESYVIDIMRIQEIVNPLPVTAWRDGAGAVDGVIDLRGQVVPVVDLRRRLGLSPSVATPSRKQVIVNLGGRLVAFLVDAMGRVLQVSRENIQHDHGGGGGAVAASLIPGAVRHQGRLYLLLDLHVAMASPAAPLTAATEVDG